MQVWAGPRSLATTWGIAIAFFSSGYLDVSVPRVRFPCLSKGFHAFNVKGCPIRKSPDQRLFAPPRSLSQLVTSFIASESQGIHHTPLDTFLRIKDAYYHRLFVVFSFNMSKNLVVENKGVEPLTSRMQI